MCHRGPSFFYLYNYHDHCGGNIVYLPMLMASNIILLGVLEPSQDTSVNIIFIKRLANH